MRISFFVSVVALLGILVFSAAAAGVDGKWTAQVPGRQGNTQETTFNLKADGDKLTGTVTTRRGDAPISDGKIDGDNISFVTVLEFNGNQIKILYKGKVSGDEIKFTREREGGDGQSQPFTAKRAS